MREKTKAYIKDLINGSLQRAPNSTKYYSAYYTIYFLPILRFVFLLLGIFRAIFNVMEFISQKVCWPNGYNSVLIVENRRLTRGRVLGRPSQNCRCRCT